MALGVRGLKLPAWFLPALGYAISIASVVWLLQGVDAHTIWQDVQSLDWRWVWLAVAGEIASYVYQAWRWNILLSPVVRVPIWRSVQAIYIGLFSNEVLPLRPGEIIRTYLQARWSAIPFSVSFSSAVIERIFDGVWLILAFFVAAAFLSLPRWMMDLAKVSCVFIVVVALFLGLVMFRKHHAHAVCPKTKWGAHLKLLIEDLHLMGNSKSFYLAAFVSVGYLLIQVVPIWGLMEAYGLELSVWPALVVLIVLRLGTMIPQAPGNIGTAQAMIVVALALFNVDKTTATGLSFMIWSVITLPLIVVGFLALATTGLRLGDLRHHARSHMGKPAPAAAAVTGDAQQ